MKIGDMGFTSEGSMQDKNAEVIFVPSRENLKMKGYFTARGRLKCRMKLFQGEVARASAPHVSHHVTHMIDDAGAEYLPRSLTGEGLVRDTVFDAEKHGKCIV